MPRSGRPFNGRTNLLGGGDGGRVPANPELDGGGVRRRGGEGTRGECGFECYGVQTVTTIFRATPEPQAEVSFIGSHVLFFPQPFSKTV